MSFMHQIDAACEALTIMTEEVSGKIHSRLYGPLVILKDAVRAGGFVHPDTNDAARLRQSAATLRALANEIETATDALEANERNSYHLIAAE